jgi:hypothetical protein
MATKLLCVVLVAMGCAGIATGVTGAKQLEMEVSGAAPLATASGEFLAFARTPRGPGNLLERSGIAGRSLDGRPSSRFCLSAPPRRALHAWDTHLRAIGNVSGVFSPGRAGQALFPHVEGWCC